MNTTGAELSNQLLSAIAAQLRANAALEVAREVDRLMSAPRHEDPKCLVRFGHKSYSQNEEDGIIREIFRRIGTTTRRFIELGVGNGLENNTLALLFEDWQGLWLEGSEENVAQIRAGFAGTIRQRQLGVVQLFATRDNVLAAVRPFADLELDLLSIDLDGNDYHIFSQLAVLQPRVVVMEYNAKFAPPARYCLDYRADHMWRGGDCFGASLQFLDDELGAAGYSLVGCNLAGANAFFVRADLVGDHFLAPYTAAQHYQPPRYHLAPFPGGHLPDYQCLESRHR